MKFPRSTLTISLLLNLILLAAAGLLFTRPAPAPVVRVVTKTVVVPKVSGTAIEPATNPGSSAFVAAAAFDWEMLASSDLEVYVKNLRAIGCPEKTIRDIITPEVDEIFLRKLAERLDPMKHGFWAILANWKTQEKEIEEKMKGVEDVVQERDKMLNKLLGKDRNSKPKDTPRIDYEEKLSFLPKEKQAQMIALTQEYNDWRMKLQGQSNGKPLTPEQKKSIDEMQKLTDKKRKALMTAEEFEEWELRGMTFANFRHNTALPDLTEQELRTVARICRDVDKSQPPLPDRSDDPNFEKIRTARSEAVDKQLNKALGDERFADYKRGKDPAFQQTYRVTERYNMPRETAIQVHQIQQSATKLAGELRKSKDISDDERFEALSALQQETRRNVTQALGENAATTYEKYAGDWLKRLADE